ncbi:hypothetical protein DL93DRAFT_2063064 [Clavulina sp. PMI_390]|nr:hypothetical protein DL93DRAFT_2063064 [Clavulina sp. PMI_390]
MLNNCRTLWDILQNCFGTVFVCIWAAIHPNMPQPRPPRKQWSSSWFIDACWDLADPLVIAFCALLMPEYILLWAMVQRLRAASLVRESWTTTHGFFILMGGYHLYDGDMPICYLDPHKVVELVRDGVIVPPSEEEIQDRSKTDHISKIIILFQTSWFVVQCIARINQHLAITELELATLAYTILIAGIYVCWWSKPRGVAQPIRVSRNMWTPIMSAEPPHSEMDQWKNFNYQPRGKSYSHRRRSANRFEPE